MLYQSVLKIWAKFKIIDNSLKISLNINFALFRKNLKIIFYINKFK